MRKIFFPKLFFYFLSLTFYNNILAMEEYIDTMYASSENTSSESTSEIDNPIENIENNLRKKHHAFLEKITKHIHAKCLKFGFDLRKKEDRELLCKCSVFSCQACTAIGCTMGLVACIIILILQETSKS